MDHALRVQPTFLGFEVTRVIGVMLIIAGIPGLVNSFARFALQRLGTPAPMPVRKTSCDGLYRYERNPIYIALVSVTVGQRFCSAMDACFGTAQWCGSHSISSLCCTKNQHSS